MIPLLKRILCQHYHLRCGVFIDPFIKVSHRSIKPYKTSIHKLVISRERHTILIQTLLYIDFLVLRAFVERSSSTIHIKILILISHTYPFNYQLQSIYHVKTQKPAARNRTWSPQLWRIFHCKPKGLCDDFLVRG